VFEGGQDRAIEHRNRDDELRADDHANEGEEGSQAMTRE